MKNSIALQASTSVFKSPLNTTAAVSTLPRLVPAITGDRFTLPLPRATHYETLGFGLVNSTIDELSLSDMARLLQEFVEEERVASRKIIEIRGSRFDMPAQSDVSMMNTSAGARKDNDCWGNADQNRDHAVGARVGAAATPRPAPPAKTAPEATPKNAPAEGYPEEEPGKPGHEKPNLRELAPPKQAEPKANPRDGVPGAPGARRDHQK